MKIQNTFIKNNYILLFVLLISSLISQAQINPNLQGSWSLDYTTTINSLSGTSLEKYNSVNDVIKQKLLNLYQGRNFIFNNNGTYQMSGTNGNVRQGNWSITNNTLLRLVDGVSNQIILYNISYTNTHMVLSKQGVTVNASIIPNLYFVITP